jgi:diguanylate cyclase (GGDEF)-like protein
VTLRTRLTIAFLTVVLGPVLLGAVFVGGTVAAVSRDRSTHQLDLAASAVRTSIGALCQQLLAAGEVVATATAETQAAAAEDVVGLGLATSVRVADMTGETMVLTDDAPPPPWTDCGAPARPEAEVVRYEAIAARVERRDPTGGLRRVVWAATTLDGDLVARLAAASGVAVTLTGGAGDARSAAAVPVYSTDPTAASSVAAVRELGADSVGESVSGRYVWRLDPEPGQPLPLVLSTPRRDPQGLYAMLVAVVVAAGLLAVAAAWWLARSTTGPLAELAQAADLVADGDLSARVPVRTGDEAGRLAATFNRMTQQTQSYVQALTASRDQLRRHLGILGDTLSSTHDLGRILRVILRTALAGTGARAGAVLLLHPSSGDLVGYHAASGGADGGVEVGAGPADSAGTGADRDGPAPDELTVPLGGGLLGSVAVTGQARRGRVDADGPELHPAEPRCRTYVAVPISALTVGPAELAGAPWPASPGVRGVLALYDRLGADEFDDADLVTLRTFAGQAAVAVDNVRTHEEAQRLSLTDPLTGLWNYRYLKESMRREVERASRFGRMLTVLALDLDRFKEVNDTYGHPAGDTVLAEFARRIKSEIREVDLAFRQGGEEFVVLLPETGASGGAILAQRLGAAVRNTPITIGPRGGHEGVTIHVTVSIGIGVYPDHARTAQGVLDAADDALYAAKAAGRDTYRVAEAGPDPVAAAELPVRAGARTPDDDLPRAGGEERAGEPRGRGLASTGGGEPGREPRGAGLASTGRGERGREPRSPGLAGTAGARGEPDQTGGAMPPRQSRGG